MASEGSTVPGRPSLPKLWDRLRAARPRLPPPLRYPVRLAVQTAHRWTHDRCAQESAALAFKTALAIVPLLAVAFTLLKAVGKLEERGAFLEFFAANLFPADAPRRSMVEALVRFADNMDSGVLGPGGLGILIVISFLLFRDIERFWSRVWSATHQRSLWKSFSIFYVLATLVPFLMAISLYHTARYWRGGVVGFFAPLASVFLALFAANRLLPSARVTLRFAALGAAVSAVLFEAAKLLFARYVMVVLTRYHSIYGAFGLVPLALVWIYVAWLTVLLGAEVAHAGQRLDAIEAGDRRRGHDDAWELCTGTTAARLMVTVTRHYSKGGGAIGLPELAEQLRLPEEVVERVLRRLHEHDLVVNVEGDTVGWLPARPPQLILLADVFAAFRVLGPRAAAGDHLTRLLGELEPADSAKAQLSLAELAG